MTVRTLAVSTAVAAALALSPGGGAADGAKTYPDGTGDSGNAADVTAVAVSNDDAGTITVMISIANRPSALNADDLVVAAIDSDRNGATGDSNGTEYALVLGWGGAGLLKWDGSTYVQFAHGPVTGSYSAGVAHVSFGKGDIGNADAFDFWVFSVTDSDNPADSDDVPENGTFTYTLTKPAVFTSANASFAPATPKAGNSFGVGVVSVMLTDGSSVKVSTYTCKATLGGKVLKPVSKCRWKLPATAKGKKLAVMVAASYKGESHTIAPYRFTVK